MDPRQQRGMMIAALCKITQKEDGTFLVPSQSGSGSYSVSLNVPDFDHAACTCADFEERGKPCKHIHAVRFVVERETNPDGSVTITKTLTLTEKTTVASKPTYKQDWPAYNAAQTHEKARFQELLCDLCQGINQPVEPRRGRPKNLLSDMVFAVAFKVYSMFSARRFQTDLDEAHAKGYLTKSPHYNSVLNYFEDEEIAPILRGLVIESSLPLKSVESDFAVDSTGFATSRFRRWYDIKYGKFVKEHDWVKVHFMCGVKTNVITAVEIRDKDAADSPEFAPLFKKTTEKFTVNECSADKAYSSKENNQLVAEAGGVPYIIFKKNATGGVGGVFEKMFHFYNLNRDEFLRCYHKRSNVESTVNMIKAKFGDSVRSKTNVAMKNEALAKILCHNLCCLIQSAYELGIEATFWKRDEPVPESESKMIDVTPIAEDEMLQAWAWV